MEDLEFVLAALFVLVAGLNVVARRLSVPYPIPLVLGGLVLGLDLEESRLGGLRPRT